MALIKKMVSNQWWGDERLQDEQQKGIHTMKEMDMLAAKIDILIKRLDERAQKKEAIYNTVKAMDLHMTCEVCGNVGHLGNDCPETHEDTTHIDNGFRQWGDNGGITSRAHNTKEVIRISTQITIQINLPLKNWS